MNTPMKLRGESYAEVERQFEAIGVKLTFLSASKYDQTYSSNIGTLTIEECGIGCGYYRSSLSFHAISTRLNSVYA